MTVGAIDAQRMDRARALMAERRRIDAQLYATLGELDDSASAQAAGYISLPTLIEDLWRVDGRDARAWCAQSLSLSESVALSGERLPARYPETAAALAEGAVGREHVAVIDRVLRRVEALPTLEPGALATAERILALAARSLSPRGLDRVGRRLLAQLDPDGVAPDAQDPPDRVLRVHRRRTGGVSFDGAFAGALDAATFLSVLDALATPAEPDDPRGLDERRADVLLELCEHALSPTGLAPPAADNHDDSPGDDDGLGGLGDDDGLGGLGDDSGLGDDDRHGDDDGGLGDDDPGGPADDGGHGDVSPGDSAEGGGDRASGGDPINGRRGGRVQMTITMPLDRLRDGVGHALLDDDTPIPPSTARRLACDAGVVPIVLGSRGEPLDVGRMRYTIPTGMRRALHNRDRGCAWPGCGRPPRRCHGHHIEHWAEGGATCLDNLVLLCRHHHDVIHRTGWRIAMRDGRPWFVPPPWIDPGQRARPGGPGVVAM